VGRAQDQVSYLSLIKPSFRRQRQELRRTRILPQERDIAAAQARPGRLRGEVGRAQEGGERCCFFVVVFRNVFPVQQQQQ
jgi:hypothetical protein